MASCSPSDLCGVCLGSFRDARVLPCLHSLCKECVDQLAVTATDGEIQCPICRWTFHLPPAGGAALPTDVTVSVTSVEEGLPICASCVDDETRKKPSTWCKKCRLPFCDTHTMAHILSATSSGEIHIVIPLSLASADGCSGQSLLSDEVSLCAQHNEALKFHCAPCGESICGDCIAIGDHQGHKPVRYIKDIVQERKRQVGQKVERLENDVVKTVERALTNIDNVSAELSRQAEETRANIRQAEKKAVDMVKAHARLMIQDVDDLEQSRHKVLDHQRDELKTLLDAARNANRFSGRLMELEKTREETLLSLLEALETRTTGLLSTHINKQPQSHSRLMFEAASDATVAYKTKESIGKVIPLEPSAKHSEIEGVTTRTAVTNQTVIFTLRTKGSKGEHLSRGGNAISTRCSGAFQSLSTVIRDNGDGSYALSCVCSSVGSYKLRVYINGEKLANDLTVTCVPNFSLDPGERHPAISLSENGRKASHEGSKKVSVLGVMPMRNGTFTWKFKIEGPSANHRLGIAAKPMLSHERNHNTLAYCWNDHRSAFFRDGVQCCDDGVTFLSNDTLQFRLNCNRHILKITNLRTGENSTMTNLPDKEYFQYALVRRGCSVEFV